MVLINHQSARVILVIKCGKHRKTCRNCLDFRRHRETCRDCLGQEETGRDGERHSETCSNYLGQEEGD